MAAGLFNLLFGNGRQVVNSQAQSTPVPPPTNPATPWMNAPSPNIAGGQARQDYYRNQSTGPQDSPSTQSQAPRISDDAAQAAVKAAKTKYPRFAHLPIKLTAGKGSGWSETYEPTEQTNPHPGHWTVELRSPKALAGNYDSTIGFEMIHALQATDPQYKKFTNQFVQSMTPQQIKDSKMVYEREKKEFPEDANEPFQEWLPRVQAQEYIRGGIFTDVIPNWVGPKGDGKYTPEQTQLLGQIKNYLQTPASK